MNVYPDRPLEFDFIFQRGENDGDDAAFQAEAAKIIQYFLTSLTLPADEMWVNLSPHEKNRIIPACFGQTLMGRDVLAQDYMLKQLSATLMDPNSEKGEMFWNRLYDEMYEQYGVTDFPADSFNKIWIVPDKAEIFEHRTGALLLDSHLNVLLEKDYLSHAKHDQKSQEGSHAASQAKAEATEDEIRAQIMKDIMLPAIEQEVNSGQTFVNLRQIYSAMVLASWYKNNLEESLLSQLYVNRNKTDGLKNADPQVHLKIYDSYVAAYKKGVCNIIKEEYDPVTQKIFPRKYFSGGVELKDDYEKTTDAAMLGVRDKLKKLTERLRLGVVHVALRGIGDRTNVAMLDRVVGKVAEYYRDVVPRKVHDSWVTVGTRDFQTQSPTLGMIMPASRVFQEFADAFEEDTSKLLDMVRSVTGQAVVEEDLTKRVKAGYFASGSHKDVYLVEFEKKRGPPVEFAIVLKREQAEGAIATNEVSDLRRLHRKGEAENTSYPVPRLGEAVTTKTGTVMYAEEFIRGPTAEEMYEEGRLELDIRRSIVKNLFEIGKGVSDVISVPVDHHRRNFVVRGGEPIMVDIGKRRTNLSPRGVVVRSRGRVQDFRRGKVFLLMSLMHNYGYRDQRDRFIFEAIQETLGEEDAGALFEEVVEYLAENEDMLDIVQRKSGRQFVTLRQGSKKDLTKVFQNFIDDFAGTFADYLDNPEPYIQEKDFNRLSPKLLASLLLLSLLFLRSDTQVDPELIDQLTEIQAETSQPADTSDSRDSVPQTYFQYQNILSYQSQGPAVDEFKVRIKELFSVEQVTAAVEALQGLSNPITGQPYIIDDASAIAQSAWQSDGFDRATETVVIAIQHQWQIQEDGDVGSETRKEMETRLRAKAALEREASPTTDKAELTKQVNAFVAQKVSFTTQEVLSALALEQGLGSQVNDILAQIPGVTAAGEGQWQNKVGGIDLNPEWLDLQIKKQNGVETGLFSVPIPADIIEQIQIHGFHPSIAPFTPVTNLPQFLELPAL